jgi:hypothetical protein
VSRHCTGSNHDSGSAVVGLGQPTNHRLAVGARVQRHRESLARLRPVVGDYNTPCLSGKQEEVGTTGKRPLENTVKFIAGSKDPVFGIR